MKHDFLCLPVLMIAFASTVHAAPINEADRRALEMLAAANDTAWNSKDVSTMTEQYTDEGSVRVSPNSPVITGKGPVSIFFGEAFGRRQGSFRHITSLDHIEAVTPDIALADAGVRVEQQQADGSWSIVRTFRNITIAVREGGDWKLRAVRAIPQN